MSASFLGSTRAASPTVIRLDRDRSAGLLPALASLVFRGLALLVAGAVHAPLLALAVTVAVTPVWLVAVGRPALAVALVVVAGLVGCSVGWVRPGWVHASRRLLVGQTVRVLVYRPRWETACLAAGATTRTGSTVHVPGLVRHTRTPHGSDELIVRMAPGQTLASWAGCADALASSLGVYSITAHAAERPGWVVLDVLRRDPLAVERTAPDPARTPRPVLPVLSGSSRGFSRTPRLIPARAGLSAPSGSAASGVVLGRDEHGHDLVLDPYSTAHAGMQGATRSGKSSACYTLLAALAHRADVIVCGVDPSGLLLDPFTTRNGGRGGAFIATGTSREDITRAADALARLVALMDDRVRELRADGLDKLTTFTASSPAIWCVMEEYPGLLAAAKAIDNEAGAKPGDRLAPKIAAHLGRLVKEGAKVGVFVLVLAQRMSADALNTDDRMNLALRITLRVDNGDAVAMLHDGLTRDRTQAVRQFAPGVALAESPGQGVRRVRMLYTDYPTYRARVAAGLAATVAAPVIRADGTPGVDVVGSVVTLPSTDADESSECAA
ncbi:FtsK/SpoIIIE domain-containing protein [Arsenicicoccus bolidensis]|uniref:FtsK domain-containing protein n=1 Tax=Arsenicicoccus bolidensis TaxID=229480 RepID=A0ABS9Q0P8_9MICO|nr:FtsK/SpoIIIE domain-containing protein [Arsenicicoccus bolidensis]MCG7320810.1 hypothetical protein [Arsenicicoccus bolidensis]